MLTESATLRTVDVSDQWHVRRIFDFAEKLDRGENEPTRLEIAQDTIERILERPWTGRGIYSFDPYQENSAVSIGVHNVFLMVWGETGIPGITTYLLVLAVGMRRLFHPQIAKSELLILLLMWMSYLVIGLTWHNQFTAFSGMLYVALLYHLPSVTQHYPTATPAASKINGETVRC